MAMREQLTAVCCVMLVAWLKVVSATPQTKAEPVFGTPGTTSYSFAIYLTCGSDVTTPSPTAMTSSGTITDATTALAATTVGYTNTAGPTTDYTGTTGLPYTTPTTQVPGCIYPDAGNVTDWLTAKYSWTTGFNQVSLVQMLQTFAIAVPIRVSYSVIYDLQTLSAGNAFTTSDSDSLLWQLRNVSDAIVADTTTEVAGNWTIEPEMTRTSLDAGLVTATSQINTVCTSLGSVCADTSHTCYINVTGSITCVDKCELFMFPANKCSGSWVDNVVYVQGWCQYDEVNNAQCNCGKSPGDVLSNFYDGYRCVSAAFIVGMAAGGAGFIIVILLTVIFIMAVCRSASRDKDHYAATGNGSHRSNKHGNQYHTGDIPGSNATYNNQAYKPDMHKTDSDGDFTPTLTHIDPKADYSIRRPAVVLRPTDNYTNVRHSAYDSSIG